MSGLAMNTILRGLLYLSCVVIMINVIISMYLSGIPALVIVGLVAAGLWSICETAKLVNK